MNASPEVRLARRVPGLVLARTRLPLLLLVAAVLALLAWVRPALAQTGVVVTIPDAQPVLMPATTVVVPITLAHNGEPLSSTIFSLDYDQSCLAVSNTDSNHDGIIDAVVMHAGLAGLKVLVSQDAADTDGELDFVIYDPLPPFPVMVEGVLANITFNITCALPGNDLERIAPILVSGFPAPSFGSTGGGDLDGVVVPGSVRLYRLPTVVAPAAPTFHTINTCNTYGSVTINPTVGVVYKHNGVVVSGTISNLAGEQTITAEAAPGDMLTGVTSWTQNLGAFKTCASATAPEFTAIATCDSWGSIEMPADSASVAWSVNPAAPLDGRWVGAYTFTATAKAGYAFANLAPSRFFTIELGEWSSCNAMPTAPTFHPIPSGACGVYGSVTLPEIAGVIYTRTLGDGLQGLVRVEAAPAAGYVFSGGDSGPWQADLGAYVPCLIAARPQRPTITRAGEGVYGAVVFAETEGVIYTMDPADAKEGIVTVTAIAKPGYVLENYDGPWEYDLGEYSEPPQAVGVFLPMIQSLRR